MIALLLSACAGHRYNWNLSHQHLMPHASRLPPADIEEITRLVSDRSLQPIFGIAYQIAGRRRGEVTVVTSFSSGETPDDNGSYYLRKEHGHWHITWGGTGLSYSLIGLAPSED
jgi:hypothetical protein